MKGSKNCIRDVDESIEQGMVYYLYSLILPETVVSMKNYSNWLIDIQLAPKNDRNRDYENFISLLFLVCTWQKIHWFVTS